MTAMIITVLVIGLVVLILTLKNKPKNPIQEQKNVEQIVPTQTLDETFFNPTPEVKENPIIPSDEQGEMPIKPTPKKCRKANFRPAPETFSYTDCCGEFHEGVGFTPEEKRASVLIDIVQEFSGMDVEEGEVEFEC